MTDGKIEIFKFDNLLLEQYNKESMEKPLFGEAEHPAVIQQNKEITRYVHWVGGFDFYISDKSKDSIYCGTELECSAWIDKQIESGIVTDFYADSFPGETIK